MAKSSKKSYLCGKYLDDEKTFVFSAFPYLIIYFCLMWFIFLRR